MIKVFGSFGMTHSDVFPGIYEPKFPEKFDFFVKFRLKTVSRILLAMSLPKNSLPFYEELTDKGFCIVEFLPNLFTFSEMI